MSRWVSVSPERLAGWLDRFAAGHGPVVSTVDSAAVTVTAADGTVAELMVPFPPLRGDDVVAHALTDRRVGVLLVRLGGYAAGVFDGPRLVASKVGSRQVHGRSAAGGQSQQRFARRREGQARVALAAAADTAATVLLPQVSTLDAVVLGGDRRAADDVLADPRLAPLRPLVVEARLDVPDPRLKVLQSTPDLFRAVRIRITDQPSQVG
ncbi:MAG TPA: acVLRF1 family peptidyl-tRNA hydrolase [Mycobacteriales bacterium]